MTLDPKLQRMGQRPGSPWVYVYDYRFEKFRPICVKFESLSGNLQSGVDQSSSQIVRFRSLPQVAVNIGKIEYRLMIDFDRRALSQECRSCAAKATPTPKIFGIDTAFNAPLNSRIILKLKLVGRIGSRRTVPQANVLQVFMQSFIYQNGRLLRLKK